MISSSSRPIIGSLPITTNFFEREFVLVCRDTSTAAAACEGHSYISGNNKPAFAFQYHIFAVSQNQDGSDDSAQRSLNATQRNIFGKSQIPRIKNILREHGSGSEIGDIIDHCPYGYRGRNAEFFRRGANAVHLFFKKISG